MNDIKIFEKEEFGTVRVMEINNEPWFVGKDVAEILGYANASKALADHVDDEDKLNNDSLSSLGQRGGWLINESGFYSLVLLSKMPRAKEFKRWVTSEVLPSIRKHGVYATDVTIDKIIANPEFGIQLLTELKEEREKNRKLEYVARVQNQQLKEMRPKVSYYDKVLQSKNSVAISIIAKDYDWSPQQMNAKLHDLKIQYKCGNTWLLYSAYQGMGYTETKTGTNKDGNSYVSTCWTQKGRLFIYDTLKREGILPTMEREDV